MWILPKQLHTSAYAVDTAALGLDSSEFSRTCEKSLMWRSKPSAQQTWLQRWKREDSLRLLSTRILKPSHSQSFVDAWTSSVVVSRANPSLSPVRDSAPKTQGTCSHTSCKGSSTAAPMLYTLKTLLDSSPARQKLESQFSNMSAAAWKKWVTLLRQDSLLRQKQGVATRERESLSWGSRQWATPNTPDYMAQRSPEALKRQFETTRKGRSAPANLREQVFPQNWPTASTRDHKGGYTGGRIRNGKVSMDTLDVAAQAHSPGGLADPARHSTGGNTPESSPTKKSMWSTPRANNVHPNITDANREKLANRNKANLEEEIAGFVGKSTGKLNPYWVEQLMDLPTGWTDFAHWEMESCLL